MDVRGTVEGGGQPAEPVQGLLATWTIRVGAHEQLLDQMGADRLGSGQAGIFYEDAGIGVAISGLRVRGVGVPGEADHQWPVQGRGENTLGVGGEMIGDLGPLLRALGRVASSQVVADHVGVHGVEPDDDDVPQMPVTGSFRVLVEPAGEDEADRRVVVDPVEGDAAQRGGHLVQPVEQERHPALFQEPTGHGAPVQRPIAEEGVLASRVSWAQSDRLVLRGFHEARLSHTGTGTAPARAGEVLVSVSRCCTAASSGDAIAAVFPEPRFPTMTSRPRGNRR